MVDVASWASVRAALCVDVDALLRDGGSACVTATSHNGGNNDDDAASMTPLLVALVRENEQLLHANALLHHALAQQQQHDDDDGSASATPKTSRVCVSDAAVTTMTTTKTKATTDAAVQCDADDDTAVDKALREQVLCALRGACCMQQRLRGVLERCRRPCVGADDADRLRTALDDATVALQRYTHDEQKTATTTAATVCGGSVTASARDEVLLCAAQRCVRDALLFAHAVLREHVAVVQRLH